MVKKLISFGAGAVCLALAGTALTFTLMPHGSAATAANDTNSSNVLSGASEAISNTQSDVINAALDSTGTKTAVQDALLSHAVDISNETGLATSQVQTIINDMDIPSWEVADLPADATVKNTVSGSYAGVSADVTTYSDPNYVSVNAYGQSFTLKVPHNAQQYMGLLNFIQ